MIVLEAVLKGSHLFKQLRRGEFGRLLKQAMTDLGHYWHEHIFPRHFGAQNRSAYGYEPRRPFYLEVLKKAFGRGVGKFRDEVLTGQSQRWLMTFVKVRGTKDRMTVTMSAPQYFTKPFIGTFTDRRTGKLKHVTHQPDKPKEVTGVNTQDRTDMSRFLEHRMQQLMTNAVSLRAAEAAGG